MKRLYPLLFISVLIYWGCEDSNDEDTTPPTVTITSPVGGSTVSVIVSISCISSDNEGVEKVELWVDGVSTDIIDNTEPYSLEWNTLTYDDGSYGITVRSYDTSGNTTDSELITLVVYKTVELWGEYYSVENTTELNLQNSSLSGSIPPEIGNLVNLTSLNLYYNQLTGSIPPEIGNLVNLTSLNLYSNQLTGEIPVEIGNLTNLTQLVLHDNQLTGDEIPLEIWEMTNLTSLSLSNNQLTGEIPSEIGNLMNLTGLYLYSNQLTGSIPPEIGNLINLRYLYLSYNQLTGEIPPEIGNLTNLTQLWLQENQLTGLIPESICDLNMNWSNSGYFNISNNQLCPPYPSCIEDYVGNQDTSDCD
jgi:Leucine-rich repeat (LRR) protein